MIVFENDNGVTVAELKKWLEGCPDTNSYTGNPCEVWVGSGDGLSNQCVELCPLNKREEGHDIILEIRERP